MSQVIQLVEIFGGTGAVLVGIIGCVWKIVTTYDFKIIENEYFDNKPIKTLWNNWEELNDGVTDAQQCHKRRLLAVTEGEKIRVNMKKNQGYAFVYLESRNEPPKVNNGKHFMRVKFSHIPKGVDIRYRNVPFDIDWNFANLDRYETKIYPKHWCCCFKSKVYNFESECRVGKRDVVWEQCGISFDTRGDKNDIEDVVIEEVYYGEKWNFFKLFCIPSRTLLWRKKIKDAKTDN